MSDQLVEKQLKDVKAGEWIYMKAEAFSDSPARLGLGGNKYVRIGHRFAPAIDALHGTLSVQVIQNNTEGFDWKPAPKWVEATSDTPAWTECRYREYESWVWEKGLLASVDSREGQVCPFLVCEPSYGRPAWYSYCEVQEKSS